MADIAGMPKSIVKRANIVLKELEADNAQVGSVGKPSAEKLEKSREGVQLSFFQLDDPVLTQIRDEIIGLDINNLTPVEALNKLNEIKRIVLPNSKKLIERSVSIVFRTTILYRYLVLIIV